MSSLLPAAIDPAYRGRKIGLWLLAFVLFFKVAQVISMMVGGPGIIAGADGLVLTVPRGLGAAERASVG